MAASLNRIILIGNLTADPELRYTSSGTARTKFSIAVNRQYKNASGQLQEETTFVPIVTWGSQAENCANYLSKGRSVAVVEVVASSVQFLGGAPRSGDAPAKTAAPPSSSEPEASTTEEVPF